MHVNKLSPIKKPRQAFFLFMVWVFLIPIFWGTQTEA